MSRYERDETFWRIFTELFRLHLKPSPGRPQATVEECDWGRHNQLRGEEIAVAIIFWGIVGTMVGIWIFL